MTDSVIQWDFFIAHASKDKQAAHELYRLLAPYSRVFLDSECLLPGDDWDRELALAQRNSRITLVLISSNVGGAYYAREEIASAVAMAREDQQRHRVVPIYLDAAGVDVPYGLRLKHGLSVTPESSLETISEKLLQLLARLTGTPERRAERPGGEVEIKAVVTSPPAAIQEKEEGSSSSRGSTQTIIGSDVKNSGSATQTVGSSVRIEQTNPVNSPNVIGDNNQVTLGRQFPPEISFCPDRDLVQSATWDHAKLGCTEITIPWDAPGWERVEAVADLTLLVLAPPDTSPFAHLRIVEVESHKVVALQTVQEIRTSPTRVEYQNVKLLIPRTNGTRSYRLEFKTDDKAAIKVTGPIKFTDRSGF